MNTQEVINICLNLDKIMEQYGNINFLSKEELYFLIAYIRHSFNISIDAVFNVPNFCQNNFSNIIQYDFHKFKDNKIGGFLVKNKFPEQSYITVNASKEPLSILFDLTHEMIHFLLHPENRKHYISSSLCDIDNFEWQANEGAAELLVPYESFIPDFAKSIKNCKHRQSYVDLLFRMSNKYKVSTAILEYRIAGLKYEIFQYEQGIPLDKIEFLSKRAQEERGIYIIPYNIKFQNTKENLKSILKNFQITQPIINNHTNLNKITSNNTLKVVLQEVIEDLKKGKKIILYTIIRNTELYEINTNTISIYFPDGLTPFAKLILTKEENYTLLKELISKKLNKTIDIVLTDSKNQNAINI